MAVTASRVGKTARSDAGKWKRRGDRSTMLSVVNLTCVFLLRQASRTELRGDASRFGGVNRQGIGLHFGRNGDD
jgi:hypothetical protein